MYHEFIGCRSTIALQRRHLARRYRARINPVGGWRVAPAVLGADGPLSGDYVPRLANSGRPRTLSVSEIVASG
jgi:hypothetical protein